MYHTHIWLNLYSSTPSILLFKSLAVHFLFPCVSAYSFRAERVSGVCIFRFVVFCCYCIFNAKHLAAQRTFDVCLRFVTHPIQQHHRHYARCTPLKHWQRGWFAHVCIMEKHRIKQTIANKTNENKSSAIFVWILMCIASMRCCCALTPVDVQTRICVFLFLRLSVFCCCAFSSAAPPLQNRTIKSNSIPMEMQSTKN